MNIIYPQTLISQLKYKHLLLDTNVFRDSSSKPTMFTGFFNDLKKSEITLSTIDCVKFELLKGSINKDKYTAKEKLINDIIDVIIPFTNKNLDYVYKLIDEYGIEGTQVSITDLFLGAILMQYKKNIFLMSRDTNDFIPKIFDLISIINISHGKGIFTYGIYQYNK